jgi:hypothetical protein
VAVSCVLGRGVVLDVKAHFGKTSTLIGYTKLMQVLEEDRISFEPGDRLTSLPLHAHCLFKPGVYLGECWFLEELADGLRANRRFRFPLTALPRRLPRAAGSPVTPVATV